MAPIQDASWGKRLVYSTVGSVLNGWLYISTSRLFGSATRPDLVKTYPIRPNLFPTRIYKPGNVADNEELPLYMIIHGGGFVINNPSNKDALARYLADTTPCLVASLDYSKSPAHRFPTAYQDIIAVALAIINDTDLPIDKSKVVMGGDSAGGNLALACVQDERLRPHILGVIGLYPVCDATTSCAEKMATRPDPSVPDLLESSYDDLVAMYIGPQMDFDLTNPRISPGCFRSRKDLPEHVWLIGVEHDLLAAEAKTMAERLAEGEGAKKVQTEQGWVAGGVRWDLVEGQFHGFDQFGQRWMDEAKRKEEKEKLYTSMVGWLREVFGKEVFGKEVFGK